MAIEINGFEVDEFNVYGLNEKDKYSTCPKCSEHRKKKSDKCLSIYWKTGLAYCNHCTERLQLHTYKKRDQLKEYVRPVINNVESIYSDAFIKYALEYRGISQSTLKRLKVTQGKEWMPKAKSIVDCIFFNYYLDGQLINIKYRAKNKDFKLYKDAEKIFYNLDSIKLDNECIIVEGEWDALAFTECNINNVISVPNGFALGNLNLDYLDDYLDYFDNKEKIYIAVDNDEAGINGKNELIRRLGIEKSYIVDFEDCKDANDYLLKYGKDKLKECLDSAKLSPLENIKTLKDYKDELHQFWRGGLAKGMLTKMDEFDEIFSAELKQYTLITGVPQSGKSEFLDQMITMYNLNDKSKVGIVSIENEPFTFHYDKIFQKINGRKPHNAKIESAEVKEVEDYIDSNFFHVHFEKRYYLEDVLSKFKELAKRKGCRIFVIDPFNKVKLKENISNINDFTNEYHLQLDAFVKETNSHLFLVAHPNKTEHAEGSESSFRMPNAYNIKGGGEHFDMSYNVIGVNRIYEQKIVQIKTLKVKFKHLGEAQKSVFYSYNTINGRYEKLESQPSNIDFNTVLSAEKLDFKNWLTGKDEETIIEKPLPILSAFDAFWKVDDEYKEIEF